MNKEVLLMQEINRITTAAQVALHATVRSPVVVVVVVVLAGLVFTTVSAAAGSQPACPGAAVQPLTGPQPIGEDVVIDSTQSTSSTVMRRDYGLAALAIVTRAANERAALRIVSFGASGVGASVVFEGSFAAVSADEVFNQAARNRELCLAKKAIANALATKPDPLGGSDIAGSVAGGIASLKAMVTPGGQMTLTVLTDGCQSPAARGPNQRLTNLCAQLARGKKPSAVLRAHAAEFNIGNANGVTLALRGIGVGRNRRFANTVFAQTLVGFWTLVCRRAHARACQIESGLL
jgi:hypothetical protein